MIYEFQVVYRSRSLALRNETGKAVAYVSHEQPLGPVETVLVRAETPDQARGMIEADKELAVVSVGPGRPVIDWSQPTWTMEEAEYFLKCAGRTLRDFAGMDLLPRARSGRPVFRTRELEAVLDERMEGGILKRGLAPGHSKAA